MRTGSTFIMQFYADLFTNVKQVYSYRQSLIAVSMYGVEYNKTHKNFENIFEVPCFSKFRIWEPCMM